MTLVMKAAGPADLLALVPTLAGFEPRNSLLLLMFRGKRTCGAIRFDLPPSSSPTVLKRLANHVVGTVCRVPGVDGVVPIVYTDEKIATESALPRDDYLRVVKRRLHHSGLFVKALLCVASNGWASYLDPQRPQHGHPLDDISRSKLLRNIPAGIRDIRTLGGTLPEVSHEHRVRFLERFDDLRARVDLALAGDPEVDDDPDPGVVPVHDIVKLFEDALRWDEAEIERWGPLLMLILQEPTARDSAMLQWATNEIVGEMSLGLAPLMPGQPGAAAMVDSATGELIGNLMLGIGPRPDPGRVLAGIELLRRLTPLLDDQQQLAPLCMLAWLNWALGHGSAAGDYLDRAVRIDPAYGMAEVLGTMLGNGIMPDWAFNVPSPTSTPGGSMGR
ncbi:MAG TPA: DUF4192 family protein [Galbitalea sp.]|jgi:hypothetical protein